MKKKKHRILLNFQQKYGNFLFLNKNFTMCDEKKILYEKLNRKFIIRLAKK